MRRALLATAALGTLAACAGQLPPWSQPAVYDRPQEAQAALHGLVRVPRDLAYAPSPSLGPNEAPSPVPTGAEWPVAGADVFVADAAGMRIPGIPRVQTNADGRYRLAGVPLGYAYVVTAIYQGAGGRRVRLRALAQPGSGDEAVDLGSATTIAADQALAGLSGLIGRYDVGTWQRAVGALDRGLAARGYPDLSDAWLAEEARKQAAAADPALAADLATLRGAFVSPSPSPQSSSSPPPMTSAAPSS